MTDWLPLLLVLLAFAAGWALGVARGVVAARRHCRASRVVVVERTPVGRVVRTRRALVPEAKTRADAARWN